jgi:hypothetical protein
MNNSYLVQSILDFGGPGQHLYISTVSKLVRQCYAKVEANMFVDCYTEKRRQIFVSSCMTRYSELVWLYFSALPGTN